MESFLPPLLSSEVLVRPLSLAGYRPGTARARCIIIDLKCKGKQSERCPVINLRLLISSERFSSGEARVKRLEEVEEEEDDEESLSSFDWFWVCFNLAADRGTRLLRGSD